MCDFKNSFALAGRKEGWEEGCHLNKDWITMHSEQPHYCYLFPIIITMVESRTMRWTGHITRKGGNQLVTNLRPKTKVIRLLWRSRFYWHNNTEIGTRVILQTMHILFFFTYTYTLF
jgi:hypothetical protein